MSIYTPAPTLEEDFVNLVRLELDDIKHSFFKIGFRLREANNCKYYLKLGFESIEDCAEALFGFGKTTTYDLMRIASLFASDEAPMLIDPYYDGYSQSQLVLFSQISLSQRHFIAMSKPTDTIAKMKKAKSYWTQIQRGKLQSFLGWGQCKTLDEFIERTESCNPQLTASEEAPYEEPEQIPIEVNSGHPEKAKDIKDEKRPEVAEELEVMKSEWEKNLSDHLIPACTNMVKHMCYKTIFDPDDKGMGIRVLPDDLARQMVEEMFKAINNNRTVIKAKFKNHILERISQFDYEITLCGRKQPLTQFCGNIATDIMDLFFEELRVLVPEKKEKKKK